MSDELDFNLDDLLEEVADSPDLTNNLEEPESEQIVGIDYMNFLQSNSTLDGYDVIPAGLVAIGRYEEIDGGRKWQGVVLKTDSAKFFIVDPVLTQEGRTKKGPKYIGGRVLWKLDPNTGAQDMSSRQPICKSSDGLNPHARYLDTPIVIPKTKYPGGISASGYGHMIGRQVAEDGETLKSVPVNQICKACPLSQWAPWGYQGDSKPMCRDSWDIVVYFPPQAAYVLTNDIEKSIEKYDDWQGGLAVLQGQNTSVQIALQGREGGKTLGAADGGKLPGIMSFRQSNGSNDIAISKNRVKQIQFQYIIGMAKGKTTDPSKITTFDGLDAAQKSELFDSDDYKYAVLRVRTYPWAQLGLVEHIGNEALPGLRYLSFEIVKNENKWDNVTYVPRFKLHEETDTEKLEKDYVLFFHAYREYYKSGRDKLMRFADNVEQIRQKQGVGTQRLLADSDLPQLEDRGEDADFEEVEDM